MTDDELLAQLEQKDSKTLAMMVLIMQHNAATSTAPAALQATLQMYHQSEERLRAAIGLLRETLTHLRDGDPFCDKILQFLVEASKL